MKILIADSFPQSYISEISNLGVEAQYKPKLKAEELAANIGDASILIVRSTEVHADCINAGKSLSLIIRAGAGVNTVLACLSFSASPKPISSRCSRSRTTCGG